MGAPNPFVVPLLPLVNPARLLLLLLLLFALVNSCWPKLCFGGSNPNRSLLILLPPIDGLSLSGARGSKSLSESEFSSRPSILVPTEGLNASSVLLIWRMKLAVIFG